MILNFIFYFESICVHLQSSLSRCHPLLYCLYRCQFQQRKALVGELSVELSLFSVLPVATRAVINTCRRHGDMVGHFLPALILNVGVGFLEIALQIRGGMHGTGKGSLFPYYTRRPWQKCSQSDVPCEEFGHAWLKSYAYFETLEYEKSIFICVIKLAKIHDFHSFPVESVYTDHVISTQVRSVTISPLLSLGLPTLRLISSTIKRNRCLRMSSCFIYTNRHVPYKNFHNIWKGKWLLSHPILLSKIIFRGSGF